MATTWVNVACEFHTLNTENPFGDSHYRVTPHSVTRIAEINRERAPDQIFTEKPSIAYLGPASPLLIALLEDNRDCGIAVLDVVADNIVIGIRGGFIGVCTRRPREHYHTLDCVNRGGILSQIHVGHAIKANSLKLE